MLIVGAAAARSRTCGRSTRRSSRRRCSVGAAGHVRRRPRDRFHHLRFRRRPARADAHRRAAAVSPDRVAVAQRVEALARRRRYREHAGNARAARGRLARRLVHPAARLAQTRRMRAARVPARRGRPMHGTRSRARRSGARARLARDWRATAPSTAARRRTRGVAACRRHAPRAGGTAWRRSGRAWRTSIRRRCSIAATRSSRAPTARRARCGADRPRR